MNLNFCANSKCRFHSVYNWKHGQRITIPIVFGIEPMPIDCLDCKSYLQRRMHMEDRINHLWVDDGGSDFYLCDVCHEAVLIVNGEKEK